MARTLKLLSAVKDPRNELNILATIEVNEDGVVSTFQTWANDLDATNLKRWLFRLAADMDRRNTALPLVQALVGQTVTAEPPPAQTPLEQARQGVRAIIGIGQMKASITDATITTALTNRSNTLQSQLKTFMQNNPGVNVEDLF